VVIDYEPGAAGLLAAKPHQSTKTVMGQSDQVREDHSKSFASPRMGNSYCG
jgi:hypothetical protein